MRLHGEADGPVNIGNGPAHEPMLPSGTQPPPGAPRSCPFLFFVFIDRSMRIPSHFPLWLSPTVPSHPFKKCFCYLSCPPIPPFPNISSCPLGNLCPCLTCRVLCRG